MKTSPRKVRPFTSKEDLSGNAMSPPLRFVTTNDDKIRLHIQAHQSGRSA